MQELVVTGKDRNFWPEGQTQPIVFFMAGTVSFGLKKVIVAIVKDLGLPTFTHLFTHIFVLDWEANTPLTPPPVQSSPG